MSCQHGVETTDETLCKQCVQDLIFVLWNAAKPLVIAAVDVARLNGLIPPV